MISCEDGKLTSEPSSPWVGIKKTWRPRSLLPYKNRLVSTDKGTGKFGGKKNHGTLSLSPSQTITLSILTYNPQTSISFSLPKLKPNPKLKSSVFSLSL
jgi:hypothetical protein